MAEKKICKNSQDFLTPNLFCASTKIAHTGCCYLISTVDPALNTNKLSSPSFMPLSYNQWFFSRAFWGGNKSPPKQRQIFLVFLDVFHIFSPHKSNLEKNLATTVILPELAVQIFPSLIEAVEVHRTIHTVQSLQWIKESDNDLLLWQWIWP